MTQEIAGSGNNMGQALVTYLWQDDVPAAIVLGPNTPGNPSGQDKLLYLEVDHLNTSRVARDEQKRVVWRWDSDAFGNTAPNEDPDGDGIKTTINLRFAGQYFDAESGLHYNWHRYYDPQVGRYTQPDPIGVEGGLNPYAYVEGNPNSYYDPYGLWAWGDPLPDELVDFSAGMGDVLSLGLTDWVRDQMGTNEGVNKCSGSYGAGQWVGAGVAAATGGAGGLRAAGTRGAGREFSHWIPNRMGGPRALWNGNYVTKEVHALSDPYRYRFMPRAWKAANPMPNRLSQQWTRLPNVYKGAGAGSAYGAAGMAMNDCTCPQ